jgi:hypothetical protein
VNRYRLARTIEDEVTALTHYEAYLLFRKRMAEGYYGIHKEDVEFVEEVVETPTSTSAESPT